MYAGSRLAGKSHRTSQALAKERNEVLKAGLESLIHNQKLREAEAQKPNKTTSAVNQDHIKVFLLLLINVFIVLVIVVLFNVIHYCSNVWG